MKRALIPLALIAGITGLVYSNTLKNGFHLDDFDRVVDNPGIHKVFPLTRHFVDVWTMSTLVENRSFRPLLPLSLSLNYAVGGDSLPGYHLVNIGIHALSAILVYFLGLELLIQSGALQESPGRRKGTALAAALIFAVHPVSGYPVNY
ncbi:MAG: hypothetical protein GWM98_10525, partial [Nitrospinaceae bacterium]|nr:hypothetical protein [Nitrospinaceae bacterium]NIR54846.1 hypothetical protein [Nitrospinaceae bacterium]NIS85271.1 hypothetical protein [Nitrospinaceae bacterium]NIT82084.1 hypothetical protein [Nitrospinaceae bacterium]NIU44345.1 hypothetical protein [Nitrospinaceae bacterium]